MFQKRLQYKLRGVHFFFFKRHHILTNVLSGKFKMKSKALFKRASMKPFSFFMVLLCEKVFVQNFCSLAFLILYACDYVCSAKVFLLTLVLISLMKVKHCVTFLVFISPDKTSGIINNYSMRARWI